jgi:hypothetical protein
MNILRVQPEDTAQIKGSEEVSDKDYEVSGMFDFITAEDRESLISFLKENIP